MEENLEIVRREYGSTLSDLKINSKPHINTLTTLAEEYVPYASEVVRLIESRLQKAPYSEKLPAMYLMDSIVKNVKKGPYQQLFAKNLTNNFCGVFSKVNEKTRASLFKLRSTWNQYFASGILHALDVRVQKIDPAWPIMASSSSSSSAPAAPALSSIHINPKFIKKPAPMESTATPTAVQPTSTVVTSELTDKDRQEQEMRQSLISKRQELYQIQQQRLKLELEQTKARLEAQARELAAKTQALEDQQKQISQMANQSQAPNEPIGVLPTTSVPGPATKPAGSSSTAGLGLLGEAPMQKLPPAPGGLLGFAPALKTSVLSTTRAPPGMLSTPPLASQAPATAANLSNVSASALVQSKASRNTINPRDPRLARDPRLRQAFEQQQQRQQQEQLLLLQQKKQLLHQQQQLEQQQQQQAVANKANHPLTGLPTSVRLDAGASAAAPQWTGGVPPSTAPAVGTQPHVSAAASTAVSAAPSASTKDSSTSGPSNNSKKVSKASSPGKKSSGKGKTGTKPGVKLDHLDLSGKIKSKEDSKTERSGKQNEVKKGKSEGDRAAERDASKRSLSLRPSSRNYRKSAKDDKEEKMRSDSRTSRPGSASGSPSQSDSHSRSRSRSRSPRSGPSSPRPSERRERERRGGKSSESKRKDSKENKPEIKEKRKSPSPDRATGEEKSASKKYSKQDQLPPKKRARLIEKEQQEAERERERERTSRAVRSRSDRERAAGWTRGETRDYTASQRPPRRPSLLDPNIKIPKELSLSKLAKVLEQAEKQLNSGALTHEQHQQLLRELNEIYNIQQQKREEEERYNRRPPPPEWGPRDPRDPRDPRMMRDPRAQRDSMPYNGPHGPRDLREAFDPRGPPDIHAGPPYVDSRPTHHRREFIDRDPRAMQDPNGPAQEDPRHRSLLEDPRMRKLASNPDVDEGGRKLPLLQDPGVMPDPRSRIMKPQTEDDLIQGNINPGMDVDDRKRTFRQYRGPLDEKLPLPVTPKDTDERDFKQFAEMGDTDLRKLPPGSDGQTKMDVDYRVLPAAFQGNVKENIEGIIDTDERRRVKAGDKPSEESIKPKEEGEKKQTAQDSAPSGEIKKETKVINKLPIRSSAKAEWEAAAVGGNLDEDVDMRPKSDTKKVTTIDGNDEISKPVQTSAPSGSAKDDINDKDDRKKMDESSKAMKETSTSDTDERKFLAKSEVTEVDDKVDDMDLPADDVDLRQPMPRMEEDIRPLMDFEPDPNMLYHESDELVDNDYRQRPFMGPGPPNFRRGLDGEPNKWQTWKKEHPDEASAPHFDDGPGGFDPNDPRHPAHFRRRMDPRGPFEGDMSPMDLHQQRFRESPPMEMDDRPPMDLWNRRDRGDIPDKHFHFREGDGPPPLERQDFRMDDRPPMEEGDFPPDRDARDPGIMRNGPVRLSREHESFDKFPPDITPADTPQSPEPENRLPPMYCLGPDTIRKPEQKPSRDDREPNPPFPQERLPFQRVDGPAFRGPRPEEVMPRGPEGFNPRDSPPFRGPRPDGRDRPAPVGPDGPRFMSGPRGLPDMPRFPGDLKGPGGLRGMGPGIRPDGPVRGPNNQFQHRSNSPPVSSDMQRPPRNGPASNLPINILSNFGNLQQIVQNVSQQVLHNLRNQATNQQQPERNQIPAHNLIRSALQKMGVKGDVPSHVLQAAQNNLLEQMRSMPSMNMNMLRMMRPQKLNIPNQHMERPPMQQGPRQQLRGPPPGMQPRPPFLSGGLPPNSMASGMQQGFPQGMGPPPNSDQSGLPNQGMPQQGIPPQGMPPQGMPPQGMPPQGMPPQGMPPQGMPPQGMPPQGMPQQGMPRGITPQGMPPQGMLPQGMPPQVMQQRMPQQGMPLSGIPHSAPGILQDMHPGMMPGSQGPIRMPRGGPSGPGFLLQGVPGGGMSKPPHPAASASGLPSQLDITSLFSKLVSSGILKEPLKPASPLPEQTSAPAAAPAHKAKEGEAEGEKEEDDSQEVEDDGVFDIPEMSLINEELKIRHPGIIKRIYSGMQCTSCGMRFVIAQMDRYRKHLDWHFRQNRKKQDGIKATTSRKWYYDVDEWLDYEEINDMEDARSTFFEEQAQEFADKDRGDSSVPVTSDPSDEICKICRENFEQFFNEETEEWHFRNSIRVDGKTFHPSCYDDVKDTSGFLETPTDDLLSPPLVRTRNSFSGTAVSPGASPASSKPSFIAPGKESWDAVMGTEAKPASTVVTIKAEPKTEANPVPEGNASEDTSKASHLVKVKLEPEEPMESKPSTEEASSSSGTKMKIEPSVTITSEPVVGEANPAPEGNASEDMSKVPDLVKVKLEPEEPMESKPSTEEASSSSGTKMKIEPSVKTIKSEPVVEEVQTTLTVKQEPGAESAVSKTLVDKEQFRQDEMKSSLDALRVKSSPLPFLEEVSPENMETDAAAPDTVPSTKESTEDAKTIASVLCENNIPTDVTGATTVAPSGSGDAAVASDPPVESPEDNGHISKKSPLSEAVATLRGSEDSAEPPVLEVEAPLSSTSQVQTENGAQFSSPGIFEKLTPPPALMSMENEESKPNVVEEPPAESCAGGGDANQNAMETQESST